MLAVFLVGVAPSLWLHLGRAWRGKSLRKSQFRSISTFRTRVFRPVFRCISANFGPRVRDGKGPQNQQTKSGFFGGAKTSHWSHWISLDLIGSHSFQKRMIQFWVMQIQLFFEQLRNFAIYTAPDGLMGCCNSREKTTVVDSSNVTLTRFHLGPLEVDADGVLLKLEWFGYMWMI